MRSLCFVACSILGISACSTPIRYQLPVSSMQTSEVTGRRMSKEGERQSNIGAQFQVAPLRYNAEVELSPDYGDRLVDATVPKFDLERTLGGGISLGFADWFDVGAQVSWGAPVMLVGKVQFLGEPQAQAERGNFSASAFAAIGRYSGSRESSDNWSTIGDDLDAKQEFSRTAAELGLAVGYRPDTQLLTYLSAHTSTMKASGSQVLYNTTAEREYSRNARLSALHLGARFHVSSREDRNPNTFFIQLEGTRARVGAVSIREYETALQADLGWSL